MASSTNNSPRKLVRHNSSLFGTIKNIVSAPLTWLAGSGDDDSESESRGKRRRLQPISEPGHTDDDGNTARNKRMRVRSPPRAAQPSSYLDPPASAFHHHRPPPKRRTPAHLARSSSASAYNLDSSRNIRPNASRSTLSPIRLGRTMSIDPPLSQLSISRETSLPDIVMEPAQGPVAREQSLPAAALASRPSFRMRSSITPQPQQREVSEPPPLTSLMSNPTFVRAPPAHPEPQLTTTLGSLVETVRSARSPTRQHSSLLFGSTAQVESKGRRTERVPTERALYELDIYKTPLVPTRLRSANQPIASSSVIPDMFKPRRSSQLVLMHDDRRSEKLGRKVAGSTKSPHSNETKPYAGEGGMKKLLARRKQEADREHEEDTEEQSRDNVVMENEITEQSFPKPVTSTPTAPPDWFAAASAGTSSGSSLRVGRTKTSRNHIARPAARPRHKFSAVFDEEVDDAMDPEEESRRQDRAVLEEAAKKVPAFEIPARFSFAKPEAKPLEHDLTNAKEPPIASLPFSFAKPAQPQEAPKSEAQNSRKENTETNIFSLEKPSGPFQSFADAPPLGATGTSSPPKEKATEAAENGGIPNFFAKSSLLSKSLSVPTPAPLTFPSSTAASAMAPSAFSFAKPPTTQNGGPLDDKDNPFWEGDRQKSEAAPVVSKPVLETPAFSFANQADNQTLPAPSPLSFSFGKPAEPSASSKPVVDVPADETPKLVASAIAPDHPNTSAELPKQLFGGESASRPLFVDSAPKPLHPFSEGTKPAAPPSSAPPVFSFNAPSNAPVEVAKSLFGSGAPTEAPKPLFGVETSTASAKPLFSKAPSASFSFGNVQKDSSPKPTAPATGTPFSFAAPPSTPPTNATPVGTPSFNFKVNAPAPPPAPVPLFGGGGTNAADVSSKPFMFGNPTPASLTDRPVTPPKSNDQEFRMEESPTREMQTNGASKPALTFSFANSAPSAFGAPASPAAPLPSPFSFGPSTSSNPFSPAKSEEPKPFAFGPPSASTTPTAPFAFGPSKSTSSSDAPRPNTTGSFSFGTAATPTSTNAPFAFGNNTAPNPFAPQTGSAPSSPSTFNQSSPFSFAAPLPAASNTAFGFASQPASPAGGNSTLPSTGFGSTSGGFGQAAPSSPFSPPAQLTPSTSSGGTLFTIGAAPAAAPAGPGAPRQIRKLPTRRTGAKR